jgi:hypothetical protein
MLFFRFRINENVVQIDDHKMMEELHTDSIDGGHEGQLWARSRARERAYSNTKSSRYLRNMLLIRL